MPAHPGTSPHEAFWAAARKTDGDAGGTRALIDVPLLHHPAEIDGIRSRLGQLLLGLDGRYLRGVACTYTNTPDEHFVIGTHPLHPQVSLAVGFSGHGFKFTPAPGKPCRPHHRPHHRVVRSISSNGSLT